MRVKFLLLMGLVFVFHACQNINTLEPSEFSNNWQLISVNSVAAFMNRLVFIDSQTGWMIGSQGGLAKTTDGGESWNSQRSGTTKHLTDLVFINAEEGWITGYDNTLLHTSDGGTHWQQVTVLSEDSAKHNTAIFFVDEDTGWFLNNEGDVFKTANGGDAWEKIAELDGSGWERLQFVDASVGFATQIAGDELMKTEDGGFTWECISLSIPNATLDIRVKDMCFISRNIGYYIYEWLSGGVMQTATPVMRTSDGGSSWTLLDSLNSPYLHTLEFVSRSTGFIAGSNCIYATQDGGATWDIFTSQDETDFITSLYFLEDVGWALCSDGNVYRTYSQINKLNR